MEEGEEGGGSPRFTHVCLGYRELIKRKWTKPAVAKDGKRWNACCLIEVARVQHVLCVGCGKRSGNRRKRMVTSACGFILVKEKGMEIDVAAAAMALPSQSIKKSQIRVAQSTKLHG